MNLRDLRCFLAVAETGAAGRAASALGLAQSTVSSRLARLEETLGTALFRRTAIGFVQRPAGRRLERLAEPLLEEADFALDCVFRGAFLAVPRGQVEAAYACGMSRALAFRRVMLPQIWRFALPGLGNVWMVLIKATALVSVIQLDDLMRKSFIAMGVTKLPFDFFFVAAMMYLGITAVSMIGQQQIERWANRGVRRA